MPRGKPWKPKVLKRTAAETKLRDEFAKTAELALLPLFNDPNLGNGWDDYDDFALTCWIVADAMMRARSK
jgi:hypothetical protein